MQILNRPLSEALDAMEGQSFRLGGFVIAPRGEELAVTSEAFPKVGFAMPRAVSVLDAQRFIDVFAAGFAAGRADHLIDPERGS